MTVVSYDRPGLLSLIGSALNMNAIQLHNAKIATYGERVEDIFYLSNMHEEPLSVTQRAELEQTISDMLSE